MASSAAALHMAIAARHGVSTPEPPPPPRGMGQLGATLAGDDSPAAELVFVRRSHFLERTHSSSQRVVQDSLTAAKRAGLEGAYGEENVAAIEAEARELFAQIDTQRDGQVTAAEFSRALGALGAMSAPGTGGLGDFMFRAVDYDDSGTVGFAEFLEWMLTMTCGSEEQKLMFGFKICDFDHNGEVSRAELTSLLSSMFQVLSGLSLGCHNTEIQSFVDQLYRGFDADGSDSLTWPEYKAACQQVGGQFERLLGHTGRPRAADAEPPVEAAQGEAAQPRRGSQLFFGQAKWEFMLTLMLGLQIAVEHTEELDHAEDKSLLRSWSDPESAVSPATDDLTEDDLAEPIAEHVYRFPVQWDNKRQAANSRFCRDLVSAVTKRGVGTGAIPEKELAAFLVAAADPELSHSLSRTLAMRLHEGDAPTKLLAMTAIRAIANQEPTGKIPAPMLAAMESEGVLRAIAETRDGARQGITGLAEGGGEMWVAATRTMQLLIGSTRPRASSLPRAIFSDMRKKLGGTSEWKGDSAPTPAHSAPEVEGASITVIGGQQFREIRQACGVSSVGFLRSLGVRQVLTGLLMGDLRGMSEMISEGKSGQLFYWSHDGKYMVKTISADERDAMRGMLRAYQLHVAMYPSTLLVRYLGLYDLRVALQGGVSSRLTFLSSRLTFLSSKH